VTQCKVTKKKKWESGYISIEAVFAMSFFIATFILTLGFFTYVYPYTLLQKEVHVLATVAERQGGLTAEDVENFRDSLQKYLFMQNRVDDIEVNAVTSPSGLDAMNVTPLGESGDNYIKRESKEVIEIVVRIPSNNQMIKPVARFFGITDVSDYYTLTESVMSERY